MVAARGSAAGEGTVAALMRRERFEYAHPRVQIASGDLHAYWQAVFAEDGGTSVVTRFELGDLLDELEGRLDHPD